MNEYRDIDASLLRFTADFCNTHGLEPVNFDAFASPGEWPAKDIMGPAEIQMDVDEHIIRVVGAFVVSTRDDVNLGRMRSLINHLMNRLAVGQHLLVYDAVAGTPRGRLICQSGMRAGTVLQTEYQPAKPVYFNLISDQMFRTS